MPVSSSLYLLRGIRGVRGITPFSRLDASSKSLIAGLCRGFLDSSIQLVKDDHACVTLESS